MDGAAFLKIYAGGKHQKPIRAKTKKSANSAPSERSHQIKVHEFWCKCHPSLARLFMHAANEGHRSMITGALLKRMGMQRGFPDIFIAVPRGTFHGLMIELKIEGKKATAEQLEMIGHLKAQSYYACVCVGADEAIEVIQKYMSAGL